MKFKVLKMILRNLAATGISSRSAVVLVEIIACFSLTFDFRPVIQDPVLKWFQ